MGDTFNPKYTYVKRGIYYFCKTVPVDLTHHYSKNRVTHSLRTRSRSKVRQASMMHATMSRSLRLGYGDVDERVVEIAAPDGSTWDVMSMVDK